MSILSSRVKGYPCAWIASATNLFALALVVVLLHSSARAAGPDHPIITEVYNDPDGVNDGPIGHDPSNAHQEFIEIYLPTVTDPGNPLFLKRDALKLAVYAVEGDISSSGYTLVNYRIDLPPFDLDDTNGAPPVGSIARPPSGIVVIGWLNYTNSDGGSCAGSGMSCSFSGQNCADLSACVSVYDPGTCESNGATCSAMSQDCPDLPGPTADPCVPNTLPVLAGTTSSRVALIDGGITSTGEFLFVAINGSQSGGTTNFLVPAALSVLGMPNEARSGIIQNGSEAYLLVDREDGGYAELYDDKDPAHQPPIPNADPRLDDGSVLGVSSLLDGFAVNDHVDFVVANQPYSFGDPVDLANVLPAGTPSARPFTRLIPQVPENGQNGYQRLFGDIAKTTEDGVIGNEDPVADALDAYQNISNLGPWYATPGRATFTDSAPELALADEVLQVFQVLSQSTKRNDLVAANLGGNIAMEVTATPGLASPPGSVIFSPNGPVTVTTGQTAFSPGFKATVNASATHDALVTSSVTIEGTTVNAGDPAVINPVWSTTASVRALNPSTGLDADGLPFQTTIFVAVQGIPEIPGVNNELLGTDLGAFLAAQPLITDLDSLGNGPTLLDPLKNLADPLTVRPLVAGIPSIGEECVKWLPRPGVPIPPGLVNTVLNSAESLSGALSYDEGLCAGSDLPCSFALQDCLDTSACVVNHPGSCADSGAFCSPTAQDCADASTCKVDGPESSVGTCINTGEAKVRGIRVNVPDTKTFDGTFSPSETVHFVGPTGGMGDEASGLTNVTTTRTFEVALIDTAVKFNGTLESGVSDDFGIVVEVLETESGAPVATGDYVFLSIAGGLEGADIDTLNVPSGDSVAVIIYLDLDNLHDVLGIRTIEALFIIDAGGGSDVDIIEGFSLNLPTGGACAVDADCSDGLFCNGVERCVGSACQPGVAVDCDDGISCNADSCNEATNVCDHVPDNASCSDGLFCTGIEICDGVLGCVSPGNPCMNPGDCDETGGTCGPVGCFTSSSPQPELLDSQASTKNRFLSFAAGDPNLRQAIRITIDAVTEAHHGYLVGSEWWVQSPEAFGEVASTKDPIPGIPSFRASLLGCTPHFRDWNGVCENLTCQGGLRGGMCQGNVCIDGPDEGTACLIDTDCPGASCKDSADCGRGILDVYGEMIVPGASYTVSVIEESCDLNDPGNFTGTSVSMTTANYGDVAGLCSATGCTVPDNGLVAVADALAILAKFSGAPGAMRKARADMEPSRVDFRINVTDVLQSLRGFTGLVYPYLSCQPTAVQGNLCFGGPTDLQPCTTDLDCRVPLCP